MDKNELHAEYLQTAKELLADNPTIYTRCVYTSASGLSRDYLVLVAHIDRDGKPAMVNITSLVRNLCGFETSRKDDWSIRIGGCGFSGDFEIADSVSHAVGFDVRCHVF